MGRIPCCEKDNVKRGQWTPEEDTKLSSYISLHGIRNWRLIPKNAGLQRCGKSCRLRWTNYLRPDLKHGEFSDSEERAIIKLHSVVGNRWSLIAKQLAGRTDNDVKNHWNTKLKKKLSGMGIDPVTHKPFSHLIAEITTTLPLPQVAHLAEAALGCFKDEMLHLLTKKCIDCSVPPPTARGDAAYAAMHTTDNKDAVEQIKLGLSRAMQEPMDPNHKWALVCSNGEQSNGLAGMCSPYQAATERFRYGGPSYCNEGGGEGSGWSQSMCTGSTCTGGVAEQCGLSEKGEEEDEGDGEGEGEEAEGGKSARKGGDEGIFGTDCVLWDLSDDLMNPIV